MTDWTLLKTVPSSLSAVKVVDLRGNIPVNPKYTWEKLNGARDINDLTTIVLHHDALSKAMTSQYNDEELIRRIAVSHINSKRNLKGGDNFPYHIFVRNGRVYLCNSITDMTYGVASNNKYTVHIAVSGNYSANDVLTDADRAALYMAYYIAKGSMSAYKDVTGHNSITPTSCPGYSVAKVKADIAEIDLSMELNENLQGQLLNAAALETRVKDLYSKAVTPGKFQEEAIRKLSKVADIMRVEGLL